MFSLFNVSSDFMDYDQKNNINLNDNTNSINKLEKQISPVQSSSNEVGTDGYKGVNYWKMPRLRLNSFLELDESHDDHVDLYSDLWYCSSCGHLKPICIEQLFAFLSPFIPLNDIPIISEMTWCHIANVRKISQVTIVALELNIKDEIINYPKDDVAPKGMSLKLNGSEDGECSSDSNDNNKPMEPQNYVHATSIKSSNVLLATHFPQYASKLLPPKVESNNNISSTKNFVDSPILLPFLPPAGGSISFDQHLLSLHEQICLTSPNILGKKIKLSESSTSHCKTLPFVYINKLKEKTDGEINSCHPCTSQWDTFARTKLLANRQTLAEEGYPLPPKANGSTKTAPDGLKEAKDQGTFVFSQPTGYAPVSPDLSPFLAIDCEMCIVQGGGRALVRVTVVNEALETIYDSLVKPREPITDYLTRYSGVDEECLRGVSVRLEDVQKDLSDILKLPSSSNSGAAVILCGHSLNFDLEALKIYHPYVVDTSMIYNISGIRHHKAKLRTLAQAFLGKSIQKNGSAGHDSAEDAATVMELVLLKLRTGVNFGDFTKSKRGHKLVLPKPVNKTGPGPEINGASTPPIGEGSYVNCCPACYPALVKVVENDRLCSSYMSATDYSEQENCPVGLPRLPVDKSRLSRQKNKTWQILLTRPACDMKVASEAGKSLSRLHFFPDTATLLRHHKYHALDRYVTVSSLRVDIENSVKNPKLEEITQEIDRNLSDLYQSSLENSLHIVLVWPKIEKNSLANASKEEIFSPLTPCITNQFGSILIKIKR